MPKMGEVVDYSADADMVTKTNGAVAEGDQFPLLVVSVNPDDETVSGVVFLHDGSTRYVHVVKGEEPPPAAKFDAQTGAALNPEPPAPDATPGEDTQGNKVDDPNLWEEFQNWRAERHAETPVENVPPSQDSGGDNQTTGTPGVEFNNGGNVQ